MTKKYPKQIVQAKINIDLSILIQSIDNILQKEEKQVAIQELLSTASLINFIESYEPEIFNSLDKKNVESLFNLFKIKLEEYVKSFLGKYPKMSEKEFIELVREISPHLKLLSEQTRKSLVRILKPISSNLEREILTSTYSCPPTNYKTWTSIGLGLTILFSLLTVYSIHSIVNKIKKNKTIIKK